MSRWFDMKMVFLFQWISRPGGEIGTVVKSLLFVLRDTLVYQWRKNMLTSRQSSKLICVMIWYGMLFLSSFIDKSH